MGELPEVSEEIEESAPVEGKEVLSKGQTSKEGSPLEKIVEFKISLYGRLID